MPHLEQMQPGQGRDSQHCQGTPTVRAQQKQTVWQTVRRNTDRKSTRLNSSHLVISYAVFCLKKKTKPVSGCKAENASFLITASNLQPVPCMCALSRAYPNLPTLAREALDGATASAVGETGLQ